MLRLISISTPSTRSQTISTYSLKVSSFEKALEQLGIDKPKDFLPNIINGSSFRNTDGVVGFVRGKLNGRISAGTLPSDILEEIQKKLDLDEIPARLSQTNIKKLLGIK
jgi:hypothetical protein